MKIFFKYLASAVVVLVVGFFGWLAIAPPDLLRVGTNYAAKIVCSNVFIAGRDPAEVLAVDVQAPGNPILKLISVDADESEGVVRASFLGFFASGTAVMRSGLGCASVPGGDIAAAKAFSVTAVEAPARDAAALWPEGDSVAPSQAPEIAAILDDEAMIGPSMRAVIVVHNGRIIGERYGDGFDTETPLLGWSMTKTVTAAIIGTLIKDGALSLDQEGLFEAWSNDARDGITLADMMGMASDLEWNEGYGSVSDVTRMLYLSDDMAGFASSKPLGAEGAAGIGKVFNYSSGTTVMLSHIWQEAVGGDALTYPQKALFEPLGIDSAVMEADASGTFVGSSYLYATARDWARLGQFLLQRGAWNGRSILPSGFVDWMVEPHPASDGVYGRGQVWRVGPGDERGGLPEDTFWMQGHDGQTVTVVPSSDLVVVRLGLTPSRLNYRPQGMVAKLIEALEQ